MTKATRTRALPPLRRRPRGVGGGRRSGFTFVEIIVVLVLLGIFFSMAAPSFDGLTPKYRLRTAARTLGSQVENHRLLAITKGVWLGVRYHMDAEESWWELIRPPPAEFPTQPVEERAAYARQELPGGVFIRSVQLRGSRDIWDTGDVLVLFSPTGTTGSHLVTLANDRGMSWTMKLNAITGTIDFDRSEEVSFDDFEG